MKKVSLFLIVILFFMFALASITWAFQNEPNGFRGVKWGDAPGKDMVFWGKLSKSITVAFIYPHLFPFVGDDVILYKRENDKLQIGGAKLEYIYYLFYKDQFMGVQIGTEKDYQSLKDVVKLKFGHYKKRDSFWNTAGKQGYKYEWSGDIATIILYNEFKDYEDEATLVIYSTKIYNRKKADDIHKWEEE